MFTKKFMTYIGVITAILSLIGGIWAFESHYATSAEVAEVEIRAKENVEELEIQIAGALQNQQMKSNVQFYQMTYDSLTRKLNELRRQMRKYPNDQDLKQDYQELYEERKRIKNKLDESLRKIQ